MNPPVIDIAATNGDGLPSASILIVEREKDTTSDAIRRLEAQGVTVECAASSDETLDYLKQRKYSLLLIDSDVGKRQGIDLLERVMAYVPDQPVILTTSTATVKHAVEAIQTGAADYLMKPVSSEAVEACILKFLTRMPPKPQHAPIQPPANGNSFITRCPMVQTVLETGQAVAGSQATVLITGESGTGKEVLASFIHHHSNTAAGPYIAVNCAALPDTLMESELFGYEKGAFTGALSRKAGKFEQAGKGTLVLDEISEMPLTLQAKLLRVLQERRIDRIGGDQQILFEAQVIAISNRNLEELVRDGRMREDLYYRLSVIPLHLPPLRDRREDIPLLVAHFIEKYSRLYQRKSPEINTDMMTQLQQNPWKGNIRELENTIERAVLIGSLTNAACSDNQQEKSIQTGDQLIIRPGLSVKAVEEVLIRKTLDEVNDHRERAAKMLGISVRTLRNKLKEYKTRSGQLQKENHP